MTLAPKPGKYIVGDAVTDGHTHILHIGEHPMDMEVQQDEGRLVGNDFPIATTSSFYNGYWHAHSMYASTTVDETLVCGQSNESRHNHIHIKITKVED